MDNALFGQDVGTPLGRHAGVRKALFQPNSKSPNTVIRNAGQMPGRNLIASTNNIRQNLTTIRAENDSDPEIGDHSQSVSPGVTRRVDKSARKTKVKYATASKMQ